VHRSSTPKALDLINDEERASIFRKYFVQDARISLGSALLKRLFLCKVLNQPWDTPGSRLGRRGDPVHGKPCVLDSSGQPLANVDYNISHQAGIVVLVGCVTETGHVELGTDVVCVNERNDYGKIDGAGGFDKWIEGFDQFFAPSELVSITYEADVVRLRNGHEIAGSQINAQDVRWTKRDAPKQIRYTEDGREHTFSAELLVEAKLRRFFTYYAYREAYIKLTGDALLASWLRDLEMKNVRSPAPGKPLQGSTLDSWGEVIGTDRLEVWVKGSRVPNVTTEIQALGDQIMIATAVQTDHGGPVELEPWQEIRVDQELASAAT
jgi:4'-phosphopantetheinyl transferase